MSFFWGGSSSPVLATFDQSKKDSCTTFSPLRILEHWICGLGYDLIKTNMI